MPILFRRRAQNLVGVNGCYVKDFFSRFGRRMGIARTEIQRAMYVSEKGDMTLVLVSFYYGYVNTLTRCWRALVTCWAVHGMYEKSSRCLLVRVTLLGPCGRRVRSVCDESAHARCVASSRGADGVSFVAAVHAFNCAG